LLLAAINFLLEIRGRVPVRQSVNPPRPVDFAERRPDCHTNPAYPTCDGGERDLPPRCRVAGVGLLEFAGFAIEPIAVSSTMTEQPRRGVAPGRLTGTLTRMTTRAGLVAALGALVWLSAGSPVGAAEPAPSLSAQLADRTLSAVAYVPRPPGTGGGTLQRIMLQAYLETDGRTLLRQWIASRDRYSAPVATRWSVAENKLCIDLPADKSPAGGSPARQLCAKVHIWGPRIAGIGTQPYAMLDGDIMPGNAITGPAGR
jgi:hypothetical protein